MTAQLPSSQTVTITIDGKVVTIPKGTTVFTAAKQLGVDIPIFCYHDKMPLFGACRVCLVEVEKDRRLQTSCTLVATDGMVINTQSAMASKGRNAILEFLLLNHPLDCPVCDRGGECPLQEHTLRYGPGLSRFFEEKRHFKKPLPLGPVLMLDRERCIVCARCTRFGDLVAGDHALELLDRNYKTEVGTSDGGPAESKFIGNTIMICPVGALTSQVYRFRARPWDNEPTDSTCTLCPVGCSMIVDSRDGQIMRTRSKENKDVNDIWLCDKGWFGYEFTYHPDRLKKPLVRRDGELVETTWEHAIALIVSKIIEAKPLGKIAGLGGIPLTVEENYYFQKLIREGCGVNHVDYRVGMPLLSLNEEGIAPGMTISIGECENLSFVILLGLDLTEDFPVIWLRLRQAMHRGATVIFIGHYSPEIAPHLAQCILHTPGKELEVLREHSTLLTDLAKTGGNGAFFVGPHYLNNPNRLAILDELIRFKESHAQVSLNIMEASGNSMGARMAGMRPDLGPLNQPVEHPGFNFLQIMENAANSGWDFLYVAGANPAKKMPSSLWKQARAKTKFLIVQDLFLNETAQEADLVLPTLSYVEKGGSFINIEGRVQTLMPGKEIPDDIYSDEEIFAMIAQKLNLSISFDKDFAKQLQSERIAFPPINSINVPGQIDSFSNAANEALYATFTHALFDNGVRMKHDPHLFWLAKEARVRIHPSEGLKRGIHEAEALSLTANGSKVAAKVMLDDNIALGTIVIPLGFDAIRVHDLAKSLVNGMPIIIQREV